MQEERANEQNNGSLSECFRPLQPREKGEYKDNDVENHCLKEWLRPVKQVLEPRSRQLVRNRAVKVLIILLDDPVESGHIIAAVSGDQISIHDSWIPHFPRGDRIKKCVGHMPPPVGVSLTIRIRNSVRISSLTEDLVAFGEPEDTEEILFVKRLVCLSIPNGLHTWLQHLIESLQFFCEIG